MPRRKAAAGQCPRDGPAAVGGNGCRWLRHEEELLYLCFLDMCYAEITGCLAGLASHTSGGIRARKKVRKTNCDIRYIWDMWWHKDIKLKILLLLEGSSNT